MALFMYIKFQMVTACGSTLLEQSTLLNCCESLEAAFAVTLCGEYLAGNMRGKLTKKRSDADKKLTQENWYEQARIKHRLGIRRQFLRSRGAMF